MSTSTSPSTPDSFAPRSRWWALGLIAILAFLVVHFAVGFQRPWSEEDNWYGAVYAQAAHNNLRAGLRSAGVPATLYFGPLPIPPEAYYVHHPTLLPVLVTGSFALFGESEGMARLVPILASLASVVVLWFLLLRTAGPRAATFVAAIFAIVPMELHYGDMVDFEPVLTFWMIALLACLWHWKRTSHTRWAVAAAIFAALCLWTDWPGYLLVLSAAAWLLFFASREMRPLGFLFVALVGCAGLLFLWQIHSVNAAAWTDLWTALQMRLGNAIPTSTAPIAENAPRFTWSDWLRTVGADLRGNYLALTWVFAGLGIIHLIRDRRSEGTRWLALTATLLTIAGTLYVVLLRNESFIHDFAPFYVIGAVAILAGLGLECLCRWSDKLPSVGRVAIPSAAVIVLVALAGVGLRRSEEMRSPYLILDGAVQEPMELIPTLGTRLLQAFPPGATILANFDPYGSALTYYARRPILTNLITPEDWRGMLASEHPAGGVVWLGAKNAPEILSTLPGHTERIEIAGFPFILWHAPTAASTTESAQ
ncbi:glycosyl transferase family 39 [Chthoniobacter flavus Ellin428]|uniref:Glycosyl transferase family 39 n=1 Tax=Chthoniobacter flavus Ellin428 TaxID=497964 RepID=B4D8V2_9BACT|nr:glycosyltransferase family 39 protein [Chthoniobacter flavus]EDY17160.1 glycosyl transferase family 39 [Chthoniobacter flavus Ellin428]TCO90180.1 4-amino-4-deoxy-L-arabinose transferase-like glycosyltransferase [Chthoniobacter flavus]